MKSYKDLFLFLQCFDDPHILHWLATGGWKGKDKQEAILRLFARLGLIPKLNQFHMCTGNFNLNTIKKQTSFREIFFTSKNKERCLNDKGDSSDLTGMDKSNPMHLLLTTSKCINDISLKKLDVDNIITNFKQYEEKGGYTMTLGIMVKNSQEFFTTLTRSERTTAELKKHIQNLNPIVLDWNDLNDAYHAFKDIYGKISFEELITTQKQPLVLRLHQKLCCLKTLRLKGMTRKILWGHIQRSGKSYMIGGVIMDDSKDKSTCNYLVMTTAPNETILQYLQVFESSQFEGFNVVHLDGKSKKPTLKDKNIIVCSKQYLQTKFETGHDERQKHTTTKTRSISWLKTMRFDLRFVDESHHGGTTELAQKTLDYYGNGSCTIYITATYSKPTQTYNIPKEHWVLWDLEDIHLCKNINHQPQNVGRLVEKHGDEIQPLLQQYSIERIIQDFSKYPELDILTMEIDPKILPAILEQTRDNLYGWSPDACFLLKQGVDAQNKTVVYQPEFQNQTQCLKLWYTIFGKRNEFGIPDKEYPDEVVFMKRIEKICKNPLTQSRFVGDLDQTVIMAFLPPNNIDLVSHATKQLLEKEQVVPDYDILCINSKTTTDPKQAILDAKTRAKNKGKNGVLVLSGRQGSLGMTIEDCDIVLLLNNTISYDTVFQMMFRCMTEGDGKKRGFVIDPNLHRVVETTLLQYGSIVKPDSHPKESTRYLLQERLINLNSDHWKPCFGHGSSQLTTLTDTIYDVYSSRMSGALENLFKRMSLKHDLFSKNEHDVMKTIFHTPHLSNNKNNRLLEELRDVCNDEKVKKGIERTRLQNDPPDTDTVQEDKRVDPMDILRPISIVISLLTIHDNDKTTLDEMCSIVDDHPHKKTILLNQVRVWWGNGLSNKDVGDMVRIFRRYLAKDTETTLLIRQVKELFSKNIRNARELSKIIDKYLIPQEMEKKNNAEVSTPRHLRQDMLDRLPPDFWTEKKKVFEPCCGKGGFLMDIVERFMDGLRTKIPDDTMRYKEVVEECLYFSDVNVMNIFICRLLLDPYNQYNLNYNQGDTLKLDIKQRWGLKGFDAVIGNPPYNSSGNTGTGNTIWQLFVWKAIEEWTVKGKGKYVVMVHPSGWRKPNTEKGKFTGLYKKMVSENYMRDLSIHGVKEGVRTFRCGTRYDWYVIERVECSGRTTRIKDEKGKRVEEVMGEGWEWFPNHSHEKVMKLLAQEGEERCPIMYSRNAYGSDRHGWMSKVQDEKHPYPCVHSTPKGKVMYRYSSVNNRGMFGIPKIVFGQVGFMNSFIDDKGIYGLTEHAMAIPYSLDEDKSHIQDFLQSKKFLEIMDACSWSNFMIDWRVFLYFRRDFYIHSP